MFGVTMWEILYRSSPYPDLPVAAVPSVVRNHKIRPDLSKPPPRVRFPHIDLAVPRQSVSAPGVNRYQTIDGAVGLALEPPSCQMRSRYVQLMVRCWAERPEDRPTMTEVTVVPFLSRRANLNCVSTFTVSACRSLSLVL